MKKTAITVLAIVLSMAMFACSAGARPVPVGTERSVAATRAAVHAVDTVATEGGSVSFGSVGLATGDYRRVVASSDQVTHIADALILTSSDDDTVFTMKAHLDVTRLTKDTPLVEFFIIPSRIEAEANTLPSAEFGGIEFRLTGVDDPSEYVLMTMTPRTDVNYVSNGRAAGTGQEPLGHFSNGSYLSDYGTQIRSPFAGAGMTHVAAFFYDNNENAVYSYPTTDYGKCVVRDLDGNGFLHDDDPFTGFSGNEVEFTVRMTGIPPLTTINVAIISFNGVTLTENVADEVAPEVYTTNRPEGILKGEVGKPFPVFTYDSYDAVDGLRHGAETKAYRDYDGDRVEVPVANGAFVPTEAGNYTIVANVADAAGNSGTHRADIAVENKLPPLAVRTDGEIPTELNYGEEFTLPAATVTGGTAGGTYSVEVTCNGEPVECVDRRISLLRQGVYRVRYIAVDYLGAETYTDFYFRTKLDRKPAVAFPVIPAVVPENYMITVPEFSALDWYSYGYPVDTEVAFELEAPDGTTTTIEDRTFSMAEPGDYKFTISAHSVSDASVKTEKTYDITVLDVETVADYFTTENMTKGDIDNRLAFIANEESGSLSFINPLPISAYRISFNSTGTTTFDKVELILTDSLDPTETLTITMTAPEKYKGHIEYCGASYEVNSSSFDHSLPFTLNYSDGALYSSGTRLGPVRMYDNGKPFDGFTSGYVYSTLAYYGATGGTSAVSVLELGNHSNFRVGAKDNSAPIIFAAGSLKTSAKVNEIVEVPDYVAWDVFEGRMAADIVITLGKETIAEVDGAYSFTARQFGVYEVTVYATDSRGNLISLQNNVYCDDLTPPMITLRSRFPEHAVYGLEVELPSATAIDKAGNEVEVKVWVRRPTGAYVTVLTDNKFTPEETGEFIVYYYAADADGVPAIVHYTMIVE